MAQRIIDPKLQTISQGPDLKAIKRILNGVISGSKKPLIPLFGGSYRAYPVRLEQIEIHRHHGEIIVNMEGVLDYRDSKRGKGGDGRVEIREYNPRTQKSPYPVIWLKEYPEIPIGTAVVTTEQNERLRNEWLPEVLASRKWGEYGEIVTRHDGHGTCYSVLHHDETIGIYDPSEFIVIKKTSKKGKA